MSFFLYFFGLRFFSLSGLSPISYKYMRQSFFQRAVEDKSEYADRDYLTRTYGADGEQIRLGNLIRKFEHKRHDYDV